MPSVVASVLTFLLACSACFAAVPSIDESIATLRSPDPALEAYPDSSLQDFSYLLDAPAGKYGFVQARNDGHFYFDSGKRARFWGVNISSLSLRQPHETIENIVKILARSGVNIVRLEAIDNRNCLIDEAQSDSRHFDADYLDALDYWIYQFKKHGIYYYINLLDFRTFKEADGVANASKLDRAAKPYALFNQKLIALQKEYAEELLCKHINPYTKLALVNDPGMAMVELFNEDGLLSRGDRWTKLIDPYNSEWLSLWNQWLRNRYYTTAQLNTTWTNGKGQSALLPGESLDAGNVALPSMSLTGYDTVQKSAYNDPLRSPARRNDACIFAYEMLRMYFKDMKDFLFTKGVRAPISAVIGGNYPPESRAAADDLDFTSENFYYDHPFWDPGKEWTSPVYYNNSNQLLSDNVNTFAPWCVGYKWKKKPIAIREWTTVWPNQYRSASVPEAAASAALQGIDCMVLFGYSLRVQGLGDFACQADPLRWGLMGIASKAFLEGDLEEEKTKAEIVYSEKDLFNYYTYLNTLYSLAWNVGLSNTGTGESDIDGKILRVFSGRGGLPTNPGTYSVIFSQYLFGDLYQQTSLTSGGAYAGYNVALADAPDTKFTFDGLMYDAGLVDAFTTHGFQTSDVTAKGYKPIGLSTDKSVCLGFFDPAKENYVFRDIQIGDARRIALDALAARNPKMLGHQQIDQGVLTSAGGQMRRDIRNGLLYVKSNRYEAISGALAKAKPDGALNITTSTPFGSVVATSLDGKVLTESDHYLIKMVSLAHNTGEKVTVLKDKLSLETSGTIPVVTDGKPSGTSTIITLGDKRVIEVQMLNGTWEIIRQGNRLWIFCDTPEVSFILPGEDSSTKIKARCLDGKTFLISSERRFVYPTGVKYVVIDLSGDES